jgi:hypothetical protein
MHPMDVRQIALDFYLLYVNDYLTISKIAEHHNISIDLALCLVNEGRKIISQN